MKDNQLHNFEIDHADCNNFDRSSRQEWWLANGIGGYACGTVAGVLTRRYHGLLIAPVDHPLGRKLLLAKSDLVLLDGDLEIPLHSNCWNQGEIAPEGFHSIERFYLDGNIPVWHFRVGDLLLEQRIWMTNGKNQTCVAYRLLSDLPGQVDRYRQQEDQQQQYAANSQQHEASLLWTGLHLVL